MTNEKKQEFTLRITQANKSQLIVLLYEIFLQYMEDAKDALADGQKDAFHRSMEKSIDCLRELTDRKKKKNGKHSLEAKTLVREFVERLEEIPDGCAERFPFETIDRLREEYLEE